MALTITSRGTGNHNTGATTLVPGGRSATLAVGSLGVLCMALDNQGSGGATLIAPDSWTDAKGNVWTLRQNALYDNGAASAGIEMAIYTAPITVALLTTDAGTMTWKTGVSPVAKAWTWYEVIPGASAKAGYGTGGTIAGATAANAQVVTGTIAVGDGVIAGYFAENVAAVTGDSDSTNGSWTAQQTTTIGSTTSGVRIATQQKVQTTTPSTQSYDVTVSSQDRIAGYITVVELPNVSGTGAPNIDAPTVASSGKETISATSGALDLDAPAVAANAKEAIRSTSAGLDLDAPAVAGTGSQTQSNVSGTGSLTVSAPTVSGVATERITGTGGVDLDGPTVSASAVVRLVGSGAVSISAPTVSASGVERLVGTGAPNIDAPTVSSVGSEAIRGAGALDVDAPSLASSGLLALSGSGAVSIDAPTVAASSLLRITGSGAISLLAPDVRGFGAPPDIDGAGDVALDAPSLVGVGTSVLRITGTGAVEIVSPSLVGDALVRLVATGVVSIDAPSVTAVGDGGVPPVGLPDDVSVTVGFADGMIATATLGGSVVVVALDEQAGAEVTIS